MSENELMKREDNEPATTERRLRTISPPCDVFESADEYLVTAEMPGVQREDIDIQLDRTRLMVHATRSMDADGNEEARLAYARAFEIPDTVDVSQIDAKLDHGVLSVHLPKAPQARVRHITVTAG